jgi:hypothetical protein
MKRLKHIGKGYHGGAPDGALVFARHGDIVDVCDEKADQLFADFQNEWELIQEPKQPEEVTPVERKKSGRK